MSRCGPLVLGPVVFLIDGNGNLLQRNCGFSATILLALAAMTIVTNAAVLGAFVAFRKRA